MPNGTSPSANAQLRQFLESGMTCPYCAGVLSFCETVTEGHDTPVHIFSCNEDKKVCAVGFVYVHEEPED